MQNRVAGMASRRAGAMATPHTSQRAVGAVLEASEGQGHLVQGLLQLAGQDIGLAPLGGHLAGVGEVGVVVESAALAVAEFGQLGLQLAPLVLEKLAVVDGGGVARHGKILLELGRSGPRVGALVRGPQVVLAEPGVDLGGGDGDMARAAPGPPGCRRRGPACGWRRSAGGRGG